jgi:putative Mg2+ transporter-C (MgtC) family protein
MDLNLVIVGQLVLAMALGWLIGFERESTGKPAGTRTYALVAFGSALFTIISMNAFTDYTSADPTRMISQIIVGIGFIGAGLIIFDKHQVGGLTTAAALWATASIGIAVGIGWYSIALFSTALVFILLFVVGRLEYNLFKKKTLWAGLRKKNKKNWWV